MTLDEMYRATRIVVVASVVLIASGCGLLLGSAIAGELTIDIALALVPFASLPTGLLALYRPSWLPAWFRIQCDESDADEVVVVWRSRTFMILFLPLCLGGFALSYAASIGAFAGSRGSGLATVCGLLGGVFFLALAASRSTSVIAKDHIEIESRIAAVTTHASFCPVSRSQIDTAVLSRGSTSQPGVAIAAEGWVQRCILNAPIQDKPRNRWQFADLPIITNTGRRTTLSELIVDRLQP